jgi:hypothetical protein
MSNAVPPIHGHVTIEKSRKSLKFQKLMATLTLVLGVVLIVIGASDKGQDGMSPASLNGTLTVAAATFWLGTTKALIWWHHS